MHIRKSSKDYTESKKTYSLPAVNKVGNNDCSLMSSPSQYLVPLHINTHHVLESRVNEICQAIKFLFLMRVYIKIDMTSSVPINENDKTNSIIDLEGVFMLYFVCLFLAASNQ